MAQQKLHPDAQKVCDLIVASGRPPLETLSPPDARVAYAASRAVLQPDPEPVAEVVALEATGRPGRSRCGSTAARVRRRIARSRR